MTPQTDLEQDPLSMTKLCTPRLKPPLPPLPLLLHQVDGRGTALLQQRIPRQRSASNADADWGDDDAESDSAAAAGVRAGSDSTW
jgi:hypothetical protein